MRFYDRERELARLDEIASRSRRGSHPAGVTPRRCGGTPSGKPTAVLAPVSPDSVEETVTAIRRARFSRALDRAHAAAKEAGLSALSMDEVDTLGALAQWGRKGRPPRGRWAWT